MSSRPWYERILTALAPQRAAYRGWNDAVRQRDELRTLLEPLLDEPWEIGVTRTDDRYTACRFCRTRETHAPGCPVSRRDALLGRTP